MDTAGLSILNPRASRLPGPRLLHQLVKPSCSLTALDYLSNDSRISFTYSHLHDAADALAARITSASGSVKGQFVVPVLVQQSPQLYISLLAILKAGGAFCPLNIDAPPERVKFILHDVGATVVVVSKELALDIPHDVDAVVIVVDEEKEDGGISKSPLQATRLHRSPLPEDLAYVMYTSGSTGTPKGVGISHDAASQALLAHDRHIPFFSRFLQFAAPTFDVSVFEIFFPFFRGAALVTVRRAEMLNDLPAVLRIMEVDACELTPTVAGSLLRLRKNAPNLKVLLTIGEMLNAPVIEEFGGDDSKPSMLWAMYGPTEATIHCTLQTAFSADSSTGNIGVPLDTVSCFIIKIPEEGSEAVEFKVLPQGEVGELAVGGYQLATGYMNRPEQTASVFIDSPYGRIYRTGDKARLLPNGKLECFGRLSDGQVKLRGQRLELGEVEQAVLRTPGCHSAVATVVKSILVVFCAVDVGVAEDMILGKCGDWLPQYMVPGEVVLMSEFPRLPSGKIDRKRLKSEHEARKADMAADSLDSESVDEVETKVLNVVSQVLHFKVSKSMSLASAGLDSLRAIKLASTLRESGVSLSSANLLTMKTISDIVSSARRQTQQITQSPSKDIISSMDLNDILAENTISEEMRHLILDALPCTPLQAAMLAETTQNTAAYCNEIELEVPQDYTTEQISTAFAELARRNEILCAGFATYNGKFVTLLFKSLRPEQIKIVDQVQSGFSLSSSKDYLNPLRIQIQRKSSNSLHVLLHLHHSLYDGWSMDMLLSDWSKLLLKEKVLQRPSFREVVGFHNAPTKQRDADAERVFWTEHLLGWNRIPLPKLHSQVINSQQIFSTRRRLTISRGDVDAGIQKLGCSPQVVFQASLVLLWSGVMGARDVAIGTVTSGRTIPVAGIENIIGPCIASLPLRVDLDTMTANLDLLNNIHSNNRKVMDYCTLSLSEIKKLVGLHPGESLYDAVFVYQESLSSLERDRNLFRETNHLDRLETPILFEVEPAGDAFTLTITYHAAFSPSLTIELMMDQFESLVSSLLDNPTKDIRWTQKSIKDGPSIDNIHPTLPQATPDLAQAFERTASRNPDLDAVAFTHAFEPMPRLTKMTYQKLNALANQIARYLRDCGVKAGQVAALIMGKSPNLYASILGIIKCGCAYLPILPSTPVARTQEILKQAEVEYCIVDNESFSEPASLSRLSVINVDAANLSNYSTANLEIRVDGSRLAYVIYTSGTTGTPKGVAVRQDNIMANIAHLETLYPKPSVSQGRLLQACSQAFDVSVFEIFYTWYSGMCLYAGTNDTILENLERSIRELGITHLSMTPTVASLVDPHNTPLVDFLVTAGEPMTQSVFEKWQHQLWQGYGPSETTNICTVKKMERGDYIEHLGHVFSNTSVVVLFPDSLDTVPLNWVGEFCFGGAQVAQGYLNMPNLTSEKFIQHPQYGRLYRSGDMGRMFPDGSLLILGRLDDQVKLRGQRIETNEINTVATSTNLASSAVTLLVRRDPMASQQLALFFVPRKDGSEFRVLGIDAETQHSLTVQLQTRLPAYMVPSYLIPISTVPLTSSGKVDKRQLGACFKALDKQYLEIASTSFLVDQDNGEWSEIELVIAEAIVQSTNVSRDDFGRWTPLTVLGVDSISAIDLARVLSLKLAVRVAVSEILRNPTIVQLARVLDENSLIERQVSHNPPEEFFSSAFVGTMQNAFAEESRVVKAVLPCTPLQEAMLSRGQRGYYNKVLLRLNTEPQLMKAYWKTMASRHDILRTCFTTTTDSRHAIVQVIIDDWEIPWIILDVNDPSFDGAIQEHLQTLPDPVDSKTPPVSLALLRYRGSAFLSFICHHALYDGVAMERLLKEIEALAGGNELPPPVSYSEFLRASTNLLGDTEQFWLQHFQAYRPSVLFAQLTTSEMVQSTHTTSLDLPLAELQARIRDLGTTLLSVCQASWAAVLAMACRRPDVCFGNVVSGRTLNIEGLDRLVAPCFNTIPVRANFSSNWSNLDLVKHLQKLNTELLAYQFTPLRLVQRTVNRTGKHLFDTLLLLQQPLQDIDKNVWMLEGDSGDMDIPLVCEVVPCPSLNSLVINLHRDMSSVTEETAAALADAFKLMLRVTLLSPHATLLDRTTLPAALQSVFNLLEPRQEKTDVAAIAPTGQEDWSDTETTVRQVLATLSGVAAHQIHRRTTIFQLGLDSINAVQVASILRQQGFVVSASDVIECPSCSKIAAKLVENSTKMESEDLQKYDLEQFSRQVSDDIAEQLSDKMEVEAILPCTPVQSALLVSFIQSGGDNYLNAVSYMVSNDVSIQSLEKAWAMLQVRHPMLRTGFVPVNHPDTSFAMARHTSKSSILPFKTVHVDRFDAVDLLELKADIGKNIQAFLHQPPWSVVLIVTPRGISMNLVIHHALYDAHSLYIMLDDLSHILEGNGPSATLSIEPALSAILGKSLTNQIAEREFWQAKASQAVMNKFPVMTPLRVEERRVLVCSDVSSMPFSKLQQATQASNITIQAAIQAAWTRVLASYLGENSVVFGVVLSGRTVDETKDAAFPCLNTLPIVVNNTSSNTELVNYMMEYNQHLHKHQFSPLSQVQKWLGHPAGQIFDTLIAYQKMSGTDASSMPWSQVKDEAMVEYPVSLEIEPMENDRLRLCITHYSDILPQEQAKLLAEQFDASLIQIACNVAGSEDDTWQQSSSLYSVLPAASPVLEAPVELLHQFVERGATLQPDKIALEFVTGFDGETSVKQQWSYYELNAMGNKVANMLRDKAAAGSIVAIHFDKCPEAYFSILGILKAGCSFVALDPSAPKARKEFILQDSTAPCLLTKSPQSLDFEVMSAIVEVDQDSLKAMNGSQLESQPLISPSDTCYCLYTSGTTGTPKGCEITHDNAVQAMMAFQELFSGHWDDDSRWLQFAALHFDVSVLEQYWSWSVGIAVVAAPKDLILDDLTATINRLDITHIDLTPSLARLTHPDEVPSLCRGVFITGGEQLKQEILDVWGPKAVIYNAYGPTEATIGVTMFQRVPINGRPSNIGKQFLNVGSFVFRQNTNTPVLRGGVGELCVAGKLVGKGYLNRPELTEERFPTLPEFNERVYRTGDLVRMLHDGCFEFLGRSDDQVKLRGQRLEIAEINHAIRTGVSDIQDAATIVTRHGTSGKDVIVSFVVGQNSTKGPITILQDEEGLGAQAKSACRERLPGYMVPTYIFSLPYIPLSPNNKAEIKDLKKLFAEMSPEKLMQLSQAAAAPVSQVAQEAMDKLLEAVEDFSGVNKRDLLPSTSIFDVGVDSITALRLSSLLKSRGFKAASPSIILKYPVIGDLANSLAKGVSTEQEKLVREVKLSIQAYGHRYRALVCRSLNVKVTNIDYIAPCSPLQQGIISRSLTSDQQGAYFNAFELRLRRDTSADLLREAWEDLVQLEAILRTVFVPTTDGFVQVALKNQPMPWREQVLEDVGLLESFLAEEKNIWIQQNDSVIGMPLMLTYVKTPSSRLLVIHIFHALYDGNSFDLMMERLAASYAQKDIAHGPTFLEALSRGPLIRHDSCRQFWEDHLQGWSFGPITQLGSERCEAAITVAREVSIKGLEAVRSSQNVTLQAVVMALWTSVLRQFVPSQPTIGVIVSGRAIGLPQVEHTIGPLFNTVPFYCRAAPEETWASLVRRCHEFNTSVLDFQHVPLKTIQKWCSNGRALFDNLFTYQIETSLQEEGLPWDIVDSHSDPDYPLALEALHTRTGKIRFTLVAQKHMASSLKLNEVLEIIERYAHLMESVPDTVVPISDVTQLHVDGGRTEAVAARPGDHSTFEWTSEAQAIQEEIALLADVVPSEVPETVSVLEVGLDSIDMIKLSAKLKKRGIILAPSHIMRCQTIANMMKSRQLATPNLLEHAEEESFQDTKRKLWQYIETRGLNLKEVESVLPPTHLQESLVAGMIQTDYASYFNHDVLEVADSVHTSKLLEAWKELVRRTPILRTGFFEVVGQEFEMTYCQVVSKPFDIDIDIVEMEDLSDVHRITSSATELAKGGHGERNLFQLRLAKVGSRRFIIVSMAHALYDGWSLSLLFRDLWAIYQGRPVSQLSAEPFLASISKAESHEAQDFWTQYLEGALPTRILEHESKLASNSSELQRREFVSKISPEAINLFCKQLSVSLQVLCQACWAVALAQRTRNLDVTFGIVLSGRDFDGADKLVFPTMNTVALRCILHGSPSDFLQYLEENMGDIREFQHYPLRKAQLATNVGGQGLFNTLFILQRSPTSEREDGDVPLKSVEGSSATEYPICVEAEVLSTGLVWRIAYQPQYDLGTSPEGLIERLDSIMQFLMTSNASDIVSFEELGVSICGMPTVTWKDITASPEAPFVADELSDDANEWDVTSSEIRRILHQISNVPITSIKLSDNLYHLGLDSISAIKVASLLRNSGIDLRPQDLIKASSISQMANKARDASKNNPKAPASSDAWMPPKDINVDELLCEHGMAEDQVEVLPALPMQVYMLSAWQNAEGSVFYPEFPCQIDCSAGREGIQTAWDSLVFESPLLRTCLVATGSPSLPFLQVILKHYRIPLSGWEANDEQAGLLKPLVIARVTQQDDRTWHFRLKIHHALYDGISLPSLLRRFSELLNGAPIGHDKGLSRWKNLLACHVSEAARNVRKDFWTTYLQNPSPPKVQTKSRIDIKERVSYLKKAAIPDINNIRRVATQFGVSIQSLFLAAYAQVLAAYHGSATAESVVFGTYLANRAVDHGLPQTYPTLNLVPLKVDAPNDRSLVAIAQTIQRDIHLIISDGRADVGLWEITRWTGVQVTSFVNFLSLPDEPGLAESHFKILPVESMEISGLEQLSGLSHAWCRKNVVKQDIPMAVDIEASISGMELDIGVFGSRQQVSDDEAVELVSNIARHLGGISG